MLVRVEAPDFTADLTVTRDGVVIEAPPALAWCRYNSLPYVIRHSKRKGWTVTILSDDSVSPSA